ncbi:hypothetical protein E2320_001469 [Naja naja]|nr:hypothetical protein E2320_001469 [Naja naja]
MVMEPGPALPLRHIRIQGRRAVQESHLRGGVVPGETPRKLVWPNGQNFAGDFKEGLENGFGISLIPQGSNDYYDCYKCHWQEGQMDGYGICEGERYIGMWENDQRHGPGIVVLQSGVCFQRTFHLDKMVGSGLLLLEDDLVYEGNFTNNFKFVGKASINMGNPLNRGLESGRLRLLLKMLFRKHRD